jgi:Tfp pilus assembly protein PilF
LVAANNLATYLMNQGRAEEAIRLWAGALAQSPGFEVASMNLAVAQFRTGDSKSAQATITKALELNPGSTAAQAS